LLARIVKEANMPVADAFGRTLDNAPAQGLGPPWYQGLGFADAGTKEFDHLPFDVLFMQRVLDWQEARRQGE